MLRKIANLLIIVAVASFVWNSHALLQNKIVATLPLLAICGFWISAFFTKEKNG